MSKGRSNAPRYLPAVLQAFHKPAPRSVRGALKNAVETSSGQKPRFLPNKANFYSVELKKTKPKQTQFRSKQSQKPHEFDEISGQTSSQSNLDYK